MRFMCPLWKALGRNMFCLIVFWSVPRSSRKSALKTIRVHPSTKGRLVFSGRKRTRSTVFCGRRRKLAFTSSSKKSDGSTMSSLEMVVVPGSSTIYMYSIKMPARCACRPAFFRASPCYCQNNQACTGKTECSYYKGLQDPLIGLFHPYPFPTERS